MLIKPGKYPAGISKGSRVLPMTTAAGKEYSVCGLVLDGDIPISEIVKLFINRVDKSILI